MKKFLILIFLTLIFLSCDRFEHEIYQNAQIESTFNEFSEMLQSVSADSIELVMDFYSDNYLNNAFNKVDMQAQFLGYFNEHDELFVALEHYYKDLSIGWTLSGIPAGERNIIEIATFTDILTETGSGYKFYGNQVQPPEYDPTKPMIVAQYSTATTCGNCPAAAEKLAELYRTYGEQFIFIEYVLDGPDPQNIFIEPFAQYYEIYSQPTVVFQGTSIIEGSDEETLNSYYSRYEQAIDAGKKITINLGNIEVDGNNVLGSATIDDLVSIPSANLALEVVLILQHSDLEYNNGHQELHNVAIAVESFDITTSEIDFSIDSTIEITNDVMLVVWVQTKENPFNTQTCKIYDAQTYELEDIFGGK